MRTLDIYKRQEEWSKKKKVYITIYVNPKSLTVTVDCVSHKDFMRQQLEGKAIREYSTKAAIYHCISNALLSEWQWRYIRNMCVAGEEWLLNKTYGGF